jgi:hypothetical protein
VLNIPVIIDGDQNNQVQDSGSGQGESQNTSGSEGDLESGAHGSLAFIGTSIVREDSDSHSDESRNDRGEGSQQVRNSDPAVSESFFNEEENN